jgi:hypothetical protein
MIPSSPIWGKSGTKTSPHQKAAFLNLRSIHLSGSGAA